MLSSQASVLLMLLIPLRCFKMPTAAQVPQVIPNVQKMQARQMVGMDTMITMVLLGKALPLLEALQSWHPLLDVVVRRQTIGNGISVISAGCRC